MSTTSRFEPGFFAPAPQQAKSGDIVKAQAKIESLLFLRHGEQQLLSMVIPLGLLLGGTLSSELVLALGNTIWFVLLGAAVYATMTTPAGENVNALFMAVPSVALMEGFHTAVVAGGFNWLALLSLAVWAVIGSVLALKLFRFTMESD